MHEYVFVSMCEYCGVLVCDVCEWVDMCECVNMYAVCELCVCAVYVLVYISMCM